MADQFAEYPRPERDPYPDPRGTADRQRHTDLEHLRLLAIFHYVLGGLLALGGCLPLIYLMLGVAMLTGSFPAQGPNSPRGPNAPPDAAAIRSVGWMFIGFALVFLTLIWGLAAGLIAAGRGLQQQRRYTLCFVVACVACLQMPLGTVLGIFTIIVLSRQSVKELFQRTEFEADGLTAG